MKKVKYAIKASNSIQQILRQSTKANSHGRSAVAMKDESRTDESNEGTKGI